MLPFRSLHATDLAAFPDGTLRFASGASLPPFAASAGIVPAANWGLLAESNRPSLFWWTTDGVLACESRRYGPSPSSPSPSSSPFPTYEVVDRNASYGTILRRTTRLTSNDTIIADEQSIYDSQNRLRSTTYLDGTSLTNAYSCCRLLWKRDREGRKTLRSAVTGTDHLYNAMEDVWLADVGNGERGTGNGSTNGFRVTRHYFDALGRETNTVTHIGLVPGEASAMSSPYPSQSSYTSQQTTVYPYGGSDYSIATDERGKVTIRRIDILGDCVETGEAVFTNGVEVVKTKSRSYFGGGMSTRREWGGYKWTEERRFEDYAADGCRIEYVVTESHDCGTVTNSVSTYDLLGRLVSVATPTGTTGILPVDGWNVTLYTYDGTSSRILSSTCTAGDVVRTTTCLYDDFGEQVGTVLDGITNRTDTTYEQHSNEWWKVETSSVIGPHTNSLTITKTQLTGLSDSYRRTVTITGTTDILPVGNGGTGTTGVPPVVGTVTETTASFDPSTGIEAETVTSSIAPTVMRRSLHGLLFSAETDGTTTYNSYDAFGRVAATSRTGCQPVPDGGTGTTSILPVASFDYAPCGDLIAKHTYTNGTNIITESYAYDMLGNRIATTDALGNTTYRCYDPFGNVIAEDGATYPVRYTYDSQSRRTSLSTTRDGVTWDTTTWVYDAATGNCLSKTYADGSTVTYTYTPDNLPLRTTYPSGKWRENVYDSRRQVVAVEYSDGETVSLAYDAFLNEIAFSNDVAATNLDRDEKGNCTNDTTVVGEEVKTTRRTFDAANRLKTVSSNGMLLVTNFYDAKSRRVKKVTSEATTTFFYDGWHLVEERIAYANGTSSTIHYYWGKDLSGTLQGAGGVGGLLYLTIDGVPYVPDYDNIGNITRYLDTNGNIVAQYTYDAFGNFISKSGTLADFFRYRFSTKYYDLETGLYYYGYRFYSPSLMRWLSRDPIGVRGGVNLYGFCGNNPIGLYDADGCAVRVSQANRVITVTLNITIYYANRIELNARTDLARIARRIKKQIEDNWNAQTWRYGCCTVRFVANVKHKNQVGSTGITDDNLIAITTDANHRNYVDGIGGNTGYWKADNVPGSDWEYAHEAGHLMGLNDDYTDDPISGESVPHRGHEDHIMGKWGKPVHQHEVEDLLRTNNVRCN